MKLQDYLNYYLGCKCFTYSGKGTLQSFDIISGHWYTGLDSGGGATGNVNDTYTECPEESKGAFPKGYPPKSILKPFLRRLEDMTEDEAIAVHREATKTPFLSADKDEYDVTYIKSKGVVCSIQVVDLRMPKMHTNINIEGDVLVYIHEHNEEPKICERVANQHHITHYLLTRHFDLFGLIDAGLAVDSKTI